MLCVKSRENFPPNPSLIFRVPLRPLSPPSILSFDVPFPEYYNSEQQLLPFFDFQGGRTLSCLCTGILSVPPIPDTYLEKGGPQPSSLAVKAPSNGIHPGPHEDRLFDSLLPLPFFETTIPQSVFSYVAHAFIPRSPPVLSRSITRLPRTTFSMCIRALKFSFSTKPPLSPSGSAYTQFLALFAGLMSGYSRPMKYFYPTILDTTTFTLAACFFFSFFGWVGLY